MTIKMTEVPTKANETDLLKRYLDVKAEWEKTREAELFAKIQRLWSELSKIRNARLCAI